MKLKVTRIIKDTMNYDQPEEIKTETIEYVGPTVSHVLIDGLVITNVIEVQDEGR